MRQKESTLHCEALKRLQLGRVSAKAPIARAIRYALKHWQGLTQTSANSLRAPRKIF